MNSASPLERSTTFLSGFSPKRLNPPNCANRPRSDQTTHRENRPQSRRPNPEPATSCYYWSWRGLHRRTTPGSFGFQHPETTPPLIPTTLRTAPLVPASDFRMHFEQGGVRLAGHSEGTSVVL